MPTLEWIGKDKVVNHHLDVPYHVLERKYSFDKDGQHEEDNGAENMIIHGDNLIALKSLLPQYEGQVKCIYIDPPYNTGNEGWVYNDNVNSPRIKEWLGKTVGKESEDLSRHDKWLCMMYPRLKLLQRMLSDEGVIFISIDDNELYSLKQICDELFGSQNYLSLITRPTGTHTGVPNKAIVGESDYILVYAKHLPSMILDGLPLNDEDKEIYDMEDENGRFLIRPLRRTGGENRREDRPNMYFPIEAPDGTLVYPIGPTGYESRWICNPDGYEFFKNEGRIYWKKTADAEGTKWTVYQKFYLQEKTKAVSNLWNDIEGNKKATREVRQIFENDGNFDYPKPTSLIEKIVQMMNADKNAIFLDSFAGSGTTAHAVLNMNKKDGGNRKFILIEMMDYAGDITAKRVQNVITGYSKDIETVLYDKEITITNITKGEDLLHEANKIADKAKAGSDFSTVKKPTVKNGHLQVIAISKAKDQEPGTGGSFSYYELGKPLFNGEILNEEVPSVDIMKYVYFSETKQKLQLSQDEPHLMGVCFDTAYYFYYSKDTSTTLNREFLNTIKTKVGAYVIYADLCTLGEHEMKKYNITFKKIPRDISRL